MDWSSRIILELLRSGETVCFRARGPSMWPAIPSGSRIEVEPCAAADLVVGQLAAFERERRVVVHRVEGVSALGVQFAGDSRKRGDGLIPCEKILGRARVVERRNLHWRWPRAREALWLWRAVKRRLWPGPRMPPR
jgi:hypothetical protein